MSSLLLVLRAMARALLLTIAIELPLGLPFIRERTWREMAVVTLAQIVTNPTVQLVCMVTRWNPTLPLLSTPWITLLLTEVAACVVEAILYRAADIAEHPAAMSVTLNATSFALGLALDSLGLL